MGNIEKTSLRKSTLTRSILVEFSSTQEYIKIMTNMKTALGLALCHCLQILLRDLVCSTAVS